MMAAKSQEKHIQHDCTHLVRSRSRSMSLLRVRSRSRSGSFATPNLPCSFFSSSRMADQPRYCLPWMCSCTGAGEVWDSTVVRTSTAHLPHALSYSLTPD